MNLSRLTRPTGPKRPWLAVLLALLVTGLGHAYLRRWLRGLGWLVTTYAVALVFVPPEAIEAVANGDPAANPVEVLPPLFVIAASAIDAYLLARRTRTGTHPGESGASGTVGTASVANAAGTAGGVQASDAQPAVEGEAQACPACGKDLDAELDFCPWCTTELDRAGPNGAGDDRSGR